MLLPRARMPRTVMQMFLVTLRTLKLARDMAPMGMPPQPRPSRPLKTKLERAERKKLPKKQPLTQNMMLVCFTDNSNSDGQRPCHGSVNCTIPSTQRLCSLPFSMPHTLAFPGLSRSGVFTLPSLILVALGTGGSAGVKDKPQKSELRSAEVEEEETYYDAMKKEMAVRAERTKAALDALDPRQRIAMEGFRPGAYLRLRFTGDYASLISPKQHCDACSCPLRLRNIECEHDTGACPNPKPRLLPSSDQAMLHHTGVLLRCSQAAHKLTSGCTMQGCLVSLCRTSRQCSLCWSVASPRRRRAEATCSCV